MPDNNYVVYSTNALLDRTLRLIVYKHFVVTNRGRPDKHDKLLDLAVFGGCIVRLPVRRVFSTHAEVFESLGDKLKQKNGKERRLSASADTYGFRLKK